MAWLDKVKNSNGKVTGYRIKYMVHGKAKPSPVYGTKAEASEHLDHYQAVEDSFRPMSGTREHAPMTLEELTLRYVDYQITVKKKIKEFYREERTAEIRRAFTLGGWQSPSDITVGSIITWRKKYSGNGSQRPGAYLRAMLRWASEKLDQQIDHRILAELRPPKWHKKVVPRPTTAEVQGWLAKAKQHGPNADAFVSAILGQGWRMLMTARLLVRDYIPVPGKMILRGQVDKNGRERETLLLPEVNRKIAAIAEGRSPDEPLFLDPRTGKGWLTGGDRRQMSIWWRLHIDGRPGKGFYNLKYESVSDKFDAGLTAQEIADFTGHLSLAQVMQYSRSNEDRQRMAIDKLTGRNLGGGSSSQCHEATKVAGAT
jgi:hypothetical protein